MYVCVCVFVYKTVRKIFSYACVCGFASVGLLFASVDADS